MSESDWYRHTVWNDAIAAAFESKLARARRKEQYLRIQASSLASTHPEVAHSLLDRFFSLPDQFDAAQGHVDRATTFLAQRNIEGALCAYESALAREVEFPKVQTLAYLDYPYFVATNGLTERYERALQILSENKGRLLFPIDHFRWNAANCLISFELGESKLATGFAKSALGHAEVTNSGFRNHPKVGLVAESMKETVQRLRDLLSALATAPSSPA